MNGSNLGFISHCALIYLSLAAVAQADTTIDVGNHFLLPNTPHQAIQIFGVSAGDRTEGLDLSAEILDGATIVPSSSPLAIARYSGGILGNGLVGTGPESVLGPTIGPSSNSSMPLSGPFTPDIITGTIFASNDTGEQVNLVGDFIHDAHMAYASTTTVSGAVPTNGLLGTIFVDTTGITHGTWTLSLNVPDFLPTDFAGSPGVGTITINDGLLFVPEPSSIISSLFAAAGLVAVAVRKRRNG